MGKLRQWFKKLIADCSTKGELSASNNGQVLVEKLVDKIECDCKPDWNENDETSPAFVKNRPFYYTELTKADTGMGEVYYKVSDAVPETVPPYAASWFVDGEESHAIYASYHISDDIIGFNGIMIVTKDGAAIDDLVFPERGIYFVKVQSSYVSAVAFAYEDPGENVPEKQIEWDGNPVEIKALEAKFLPDVFYTRKIDRDDGQQVDAVSGIRFANSQGAERVLWIYNDTLRVTSLDDFINGVIQN